MKKLLMLILTTAFCGTSAYGMVIENESEYRVSYFIKADNNNVVTSTIEPKGKQNTGVYSLREDNEISIIVRVENCLNYCSLYNPSSKYNYDKILQKLERSITFPSIKGTKNYKPWDNFKTMDYFEDVILTYTLNGDIYLEGTKATLSMRLKEPLPGEKNWFKRSNSFEIK